MAKSNLSPQERARLLEHEVTDRAYITQPQLELIERLLERHSMWDWTDFRQVCREAFCETDQDGLELEADQQEWAQLSRVQASAVIDYLKLG